jgi:hypothetical protein
MWREIYDFIPNFKRKDIIKCSIETGSGGMTYDARDL